MDVLAIPSDPESTTNNVQTLLQRHPDGFRWAVSEKTLSDNGIVIAQAIIQGTAITVSDGFLKDSQGTSAFILEGCSKQGRLVGVNVIPGDDSSQSPYCSKLGGADPDLAPSCFRMALQAPAKIRNAMKKESTFSII